MPEEKKKVVALLSDLMFTVKIQEAAKRAGVHVIFVKTEQEAIAQAKQHPSVIILDLNNNNIDVLQVIGNLKSDIESSKISLLGYVSHVQAELKRAAEERGCDLVLPRSAFSHNLPAILKRYAEA